MFFILSSLNINLEYFPKISYVETQDTRNKPIFDVLNLPHYL